MTGILRPRVALALVVSLSLGLATAAMADSAAIEQQQGAQILTEIQQGKLNPKSLTSAQYEKLGEDLMGRALGSTQLHQRMNTLMNEMMGPTAADQMHIYLAKRYLGISATPGSRYGPVYGLMGVMMSGYHGSALAGMMGAYLNGQGTAGYTMGPGMMGHGYDSSGGWSTGAVITVAVLAALVLVGLALTLPRLRQRSRPPGP